MNTKLIKLDINRELYTNIVAKQGDIDSRFLLFSLVDNSLPFSLLNRTVRVYGRKADGKEIFNDLVVNDANKGICTLELTSQALAVAGILEVELVVYEVNKKLSSIPFKINVIESLNSDDAVISTNEFTALQEALSKIQNIDNRFNEVNSQLDKSIKLISNIEIDVTTLGVSGNGSTDDTEKIKEALKLYKKLYFPYVENGGYRITSSIILESHSIRMDKRAYFKKDFDGVGVYCVGGSIYTNLEDVKISGSGAGEATGNEKTNGHGIVVIGNRVNFKNVTSQFNRGNGFEFVCNSTAESGYVLPVAYSCNMNKCIIDNINSYGNDGIGVLLKGTQDDISVWRFNIYTQANRENGFVVDEESKFRNSVGFIYSEADGKKNINTSHSVWFKNAGGIVVDIYSEGQQNLNATEIMVESKASVTITSLRNNRDVNLSDHSTFLDGSGAIIGRRFGVTTTNKQSEVFANNKINNVGTIHQSKFIDYNLTENATTKNFTRITSSQLKNITLKTDKTAITKSEKTIEYNGIVPSETKMFSNGDIDNPVDVKVGDILHSTVIQGFKDGYYRQGGKIDYVVTGVATGKLTTEIVFYNAQGANSFSEVLRIDGLGQIKIPKLIGTGDRPLMVSSTGILKV